MEGNYSNLENQSVDQFLSRLTRILENYLIELESVDVIKEETVTKYRVHVKSGHNNDIIRKLRYDIASGLGLKSIKVIITPDYAELDISNDNH